MGCEMNVFILEGVCICYTNVYSMSLLWISQAMQ